MAAASRLVLDQGVGRTTIADVQAAAKVGPSQPYRYFAGKDALVCAVIELQTDETLKVQANSLAGLDSFAALQGWRGELLDFRRRRLSMGGCPLGTLAVELSETGWLATSFARWEEMPRHGIVAMRDRGELRADADPDQLALALLVVVQGSLLLSKARRETVPLEVTIDLAIAHLKTLRPDG